MYLKKALGVFNIFFLYCKLSRKKAKINGPDPAIHTQIRTFFFFTFLSCQEQHLERNAFSGKKKSSKILLKFVKQMM